MKTEEVLKQCVESMKNAMERLDGIEGDAGIRSEGTLFKLNEAVNAAEQELMENTTGEQKKAMTRCIHCDCEIEDGKLDCSNGCYAKHNERIDGPTQEKLERIVQLLERMSEQLDAIAFRIRESN